MNSVALNVFIAIIGISAGPAIIAGLKSVGVGLLVCGLIAASVPMLLAPLIGKYIFNFHPRKKRDILLIIAPQEVE